MSDPQPQRRDDHDEPPRPPARRPTFDEVLGRGDEPGGDEPGDDEPDDMDDADVANGEPGARDSGRGER